MKLGDVAAMRARSASSLTANFQVCVKRRTILLLTQALALHCPTDLLPQKAFKGAPPVQ